MWHSIHFTDFPSLFSSYPLCSIIMLCFFSSHWLPVRLYCCHRGGSLVSTFFVPRFCKFCLVSSLNIFIWIYWVSLFSYFLILWAWLALSASVSLSTVQLLWHLSLCIFEKSSSFSVLSFLLSEPVSVSASIDNFFPVSYLSLHDFFQ